MTIQTFHGLLPNGSAGSFLTIGFGPWGAAHTVGITNVPMVSLNCDAYVVPQPPNATRYSKKLAGSGAQAGLMAYADHVSGLDTPTKNGHAHVAESGGGNSLLLINVVRKHADDIALLIEYTQAFVRQALSTASRAGAFRVAFPADDIGLSFDFSARVMLGAVKEYWEESLVSGPHEVVFTSEKNDDALRAFDGVSREIFAGQHETKEGNDNGPGIIRGTLHFFEDFFHIGDGSLRRKILASLNSDGLDGVEVNALAELSKVQPGIFDGEIVKRLGVLSFDSRRPIARSARETLKNLFLSDSEVRKSAGRQLALVARHKAYGRAEEMRFIYAERGTQDPAAQFTTGEKK